MNDWVNNHEAGEVRRYRAHYDVTVMKPQQSVEFIYIYTAHKKFMNTSTSAESVASFILEGRYLENQTT